MISTKGPKAPGPRSKAQGPTLCGKNGTMLPGARPQARPQATAENNKKSNNNAAVNIPAAARGPRPRAEGWKDCPVIPTQRHPWALGHHNNN